MNLPYLSPMSRTHSKKSSWYAFNGKADALTYGANYPGTRFDYGKANQFATTPQCGGPFGPNSTYCVTIIKPVPLGH